MSESARRRASPSRERWVEIEAAFSDDVRLRLFRTICDAVRHAHQNLVAHQDLKDPIPPGLAL